MVQQISKGCPNCCSGSVIGWGSYERKCKIILGKKKIPIRRLQCKCCKKTHRYLPPFLIPFKQYDIAVIATSLHQIFENGRAYLKATTVGLDVSTVVRYTQYYLKKSEQILIWVKQMLLNWVPGYSYEKDSRLIIDTGSDRNNMKQALILSDTLIRMVSIKRSGEWDSFSLINFGMLR